MNPITAINKVSSECHNRPHKASDCLAKASERVKVTKSFNDVLEQEKLRLEGNDFNGKKKNK